MRNALTSTSVVLSKTTLRCKELRQARRAPSKTSTGNGGPDGLDDTASRLAAARAAVNADSAAESEKSQDAVSPRQNMQSTSPATAASTNTALSVSTTRDEVLNALKSNLKVADNFNKLSLSSGYTAPVDTERVLKQADLDCAEKYFDDEEKQGLPMLAATMADFSISA